MELNFEDWMKLRKEDIAKYLITAEKNIGILRAFRDSLEYAGKLNIENEEYEVYMREVK